MYTSVIKALTIEVKVIPKKHISTIYSITPIVIKQIMDTGRKFIIRSI